MGPAIPLFIRLCDNVQKTGEFGVYPLFNCTSNPIPITPLFTGTYKLIKTDLQRLALDEANDRLYIFDHSKREYQPLSGEIRQQLDGGRLGV